MTAPATSQRTNVVPDDEAYAPQVQILIGGQDMTENLMNDVIELRVTLQRDELGGFSLQLANHYELALDNPPQPRVPDGTYRHSDDPRLDVFKPVTIAMGYPGRLVPLFVGEIIGLQPAFPSSGLPTLTITGTDILQRLRRSKPDGDTRKSFPASMADWEIAQLVAARHKLGFSKLSNTKDSKNTLETTQRDMDDLKFVMWLAKRNDYECCVVIEDKKPALYFGPATDKRPGNAVKQVGFTYGQSLISFTPKLKIASQVASVTVRGWDRRTKKPIEFKATSKHLPKTGGTGTTGPDLVAKEVGAKGERVVDWPVHSRDEAKRLAIQLLTETANQYLSGSGEAMGEPEVVPGINVELAGLGCRYNGVYYVVKVDHVFGASGYTTSFDVERIKDNQCPPKDGVKP